MDNGISWLAALGFAAGWEERRRKKEARARQDFLAQRRADLSAAILALHESIRVLTLDGGCVGIRADFAEDVKLAPLFAIGEVLSAQGEILPEQETALKIFLTNVAPRYNYAQFTQATIGRSGIYREYWNVVGLSEEACGTLWQTLFECIYRTRLLDKLQEIDDQLSLIVIHFANLGQPDSLLAQPICDRILRCLNRHVNDYQNTPHIHALILLQEKLLALRGLAIEEHLLLRAEDAGLEDGRNYYVYRVYRKDTWSPCGTFAVRELHQSESEGTLDATDRDAIYSWDQESGSYHPFFLEQA